MNPTELPPVASIAAIRGHFPALRRVHGQETAGAAVNAAPHGGVERKT
jgi:hypothetical protein